MASHVLIYGAGTLGLMTLEVAKRTGASTVDVVDVNPERPATGIDVHRIVSGHCLVGRPWRAATRPTPYAVGQDSTAPRR